MNDAEIMDLFWARNEDAIQETDRAYGRSFSLWPIRFCIIGKMQRKV